MKKPIYLLQKIYFLLLVAFFIFIVTITHFIQGDITVSENIIISEEYVESAFIFLMLSLSYVIFKLYQREVKTREQTIEKEKRHNQGNKNQLADALKYIGQVNVQIREINDVFAKLKEFPKKKNDFKNVISFLTEKALGIVNADWILLRILDIESGQILREKAQTRGNSILLKYEISNQSLIKNEAIDGYSIVASNQNNLGLKAYFIFPIKKIKKDQEILIRAITNQLEMMFIIFNSQYFKK